MQDQGIENIQPTEENAPPAPINPSNPSWRISKSSIIGLLAVLSVPALWMLFIIPGYIPRLQYSHELSMFAPLPGCSEAKRSYRNPDLDAVRQFKVAYKCDGRQSSLAYASAISQYSKNGFSGKDFDNTEGRSEGPPGYYSYEYMFSYTNKSWCIAYEFDPRERLTDKQKFQTQPITGYTVDVEGGDHCYISDGASTVHIRYPAIDYNNPNRTDAYTAFDKVDQVKAQPYFFYHNLTNEVGQPLCGLSTVTQANGVTEPLGKLTGNELLTVTIANGCVQKIQITGKRPGWLYPGR